MPRQKSTEDPVKPRVQTAARTVAILQAVGRAGGDGITAKQLSEELGLPRQVVYHLVHTLVQVKMLRRARGTNLVLGIGVAALAHGFHMQMSSSGFLARCAKAAADATGETAYVSGWLDGEIVVLATARGSAPIQAAEVPQGTTGFAHARASGKLLLAMCPAEEIDAYLASHRLQSRTANTITRAAALRAELEADLDGHRRALLATREQLQSLEAEYAAVLADRAAIVADRAAIVADRAAIDADRTRITAEREETQARLVQAEAVIRDQQRQLGEAAAAIAAQDALIGALRAELKHRWKSLKRALGPKRPTPGEG